MHTAVQRTHQLLALLKISRHLLRRQVTSNHSAKKRRSPLLQTYVQAWRVKQTNYSTKESTTQHNEHCCPMLASLYIFPPEASQQPTQNQRVECSTNYFTSRDHHPHRQRSPLEQLAPLPPLLPPLPIGHPLPLPLHRMKTLKSSRETQTPWGCRWHLRPMRRRTPHSNPRP